MGSDASVRTVYTLENTKRCGSILGTFTRRRQNAEHKIFAHYIKKKEQITLGKHPNGTRDEASYVLDNRLNTLVEIQSLPSKKNGSSSTGDMSSLTISTSYDPISKKSSSLCERKWSSCLTVNDRFRDRSAF